MKKTYSYNCEEVSLEQLPEELRSHITQAEDFFNKLDKAPTQEAKEEVINTHPYNQD